MTKKKANKLKEPIDNAKFQQLKTFWKACKLYFSNKINNKRVIFTQNRTMSL